MQALVAALGATVAIALRRSAGCDRGHRAAPPPQPSDYNSWSAEKKHQWFVDNLDIGQGGSSEVADQFSGWPRDPKACIDGEFIRPGGFKTRSDVVEPYEVRAFNLHPTGVVAKVKATWNSNAGRYTGLFKKADLGFARWGFQSLTFGMSVKIAAVESYADGSYTPEPMSSAWNESVDCVAMDCFNVTKPPVYDEEELEDGDRPDTGTFLAVKFFRDGVPSGSLHLGGFSTTWDHISSWYSNLGPAFPGDGPNVTLYGANSLAEQGAQRGTRWPGFTGLHDLAMYDQDGNLEHDIMFPYQLLLEPTQDAKNAIPKTCVGLPQRAIALAKGKLRAGTPVYNIVAKHSFEAPMVVIGQLELASELMLSADTDRQVFFYHNRFERDLVLRPDLAEGYGCKEYWFCPVCPWIPELCSPDEEALKIYDQFRRGEITFDRAFPKARRHSEPARCRRHMSQEQVVHEKRELERARNWIKHAKSQKERLEGRSPGSPEPPSGEVAPWPPWKESQIPNAAGFCTGPANGAGADAAHLRGGASLKQVGSHRRLGRGRAEMRGDDPPSGFAPDQNMTRVWDPVSDFEHIPEWLCQWRPNEWPTSPRPSPWTTNCKRTRVQPRYPSELEYAVDNATCTKLPRCNKRDGTWYSETYPCKCGSGTCQSGQLCREASSTCTSWGPYAK